MSNLKGPRSILYTAIRRRQPAGVVREAEPHLQNDGMSASSKCFICSKPSPSEIVDQVKSNEGTSPYHPTTAPPTQRGESTAIVIHRSIDRAGGYYDLGTSSRVDFLADGTRIPAPGPVPNIRKAGTCVAGISANAWSCKFIRGGTGKPAQKPLGGRTTRDSLPNPRKTDEQPLTSQNSPRSGDLFGTSR